MASASCSHRAVEPSMSVNKKVTVPVGNPVMAMAVCPVPQYSTLREHRSAVSPTESPGNPAHTFTNGSKVHQPDSPGAENACRRGPTSGTSLPGIWDRRGNHYDLTPPPDARDRENPG
jgi:hypothetical protein